MKSIFFAVAMSAALSAPAALAKPGEGHGRGHDKHPSASSRAQVAEPDAGGGVGSPRARRAWSNPAGRAHPHGMPPGQVKKLATENGGLRVGAVLPSDYPGYRPLAASRAIGLPAAPAGQEYVRVGDDVYLRQMTTGVISTVLRDLIR